MSGKIDDLIPSAKELRQQAAIKEAEKADEHLRLMAAADAEKRALIEKLSKPSGLSEQEKIELASSVIQRRTATSASAPSVSVPSAGRRMARVRD